MVARELRWRRQWRGAPSPADRILVSWHHTLEGLRRTGIDIPPSDTPHEVAGHVGSLLVGAEAGPAGAEADPLEELAEQATAAAYSGQVDAGDPDRCEDLRTQLQHHAVSRLPVRRRLVWRFLPA